MDRYTIIIPRTALGTDSGALRIWWEYFCFFYLFRTAIARRSSAVSHEVVHEIVLEHSDIQAWGLGLGSGIRSSNILTHVLLAAFGNLEMNKALVLGGSTTTCVAGSGFNCPRKESFNSMEAKLFRETRQEAYRVCNLFCARCQAGENWDLNPFEQKIPS